MLFKNNRKVLHRQPSPTFFFYFLPTAELDLKNVRMLNTGISEYVRPKADSATTERNHIRLKSFEMKNDRVDNCHAKQ